jgi:hypothetical protein
MYWDSVNWILLVVAVIFFIFSLLYMWGEGEVGVGLLVVTAVLVGAMFIRTNIHVHDIHDQAAKAELQKLGLNVQDVDTAGHTVTILIGGCYRYLDLHKYNGEWQLFAENADGTRVPFPASLARSTGKACAANIH